MDTQIFALTHNAADVWIARDGQASVNYSYGGTRMVHPQLADHEVTAVISQLMYYESTFKNRLINYAIQQGILKSYQDRLPDGFLQSTVGGARCIIRPRTPAIASVLKNPGHAEFYPTLSPIFEQIGFFLNERGGDIKLTPDFGRYAELSDFLAQFTPHVLGIRCEDGGCGGKSSYSATGIIAALEVLGIEQYKERPVTLIGSAGALGSDVLAYFLRNNYRDLAVCDLVYDDPESKVTAPESAHKLPSQRKRFTEACLKRGGVIVATTVGEELENSNWAVIPRGTQLILAHNLAIPAGTPGQTLTQQLAERDVYVVPGQVLTLGGALTSRLEWFWRRAKPGLPFDKPLAHLVVREVVSYLTAETRRRALSQGIMPYLAAVELAQMSLI